MIRHLSIIIAAGCTVLAGTLPAAAADSYPSRPIRVIVPQSAAGSTDVAARALTDRLSESLKQNIVVDNRPGAGSLNGTEMVAKAAPDGYTLLAIAASLTITPAMHSKLPFGPGTDFAPITQIADLPHIVVVHPSVAAKNIPELVALLKSRPGQITCGYSGIGTSTHLAIELFQYMSQTKMLLVPYKGGTPAMTALLGGEVQVNFAARSTALPHIRAGKLRALANVQPRCPSCRRWRKPGSRATSTPPGSDCWRRQKHRRRSSTACTRSRSGSSPATRSRPCC